MGLYDDLKKNLDPETLAKVTEQMGEEYDFNQVPYSRLQKVIRERNELRDKVNTNASNSDHDEYEQNASGQQNQQGQGQAQNQQQPAGLTQADLQKAIAKATKEVQAKADKQIAAMQLRSAALLQLRDANCIDPEVLYDSVRIDKSLLSLDATGKVEGLTEQIETLEKASPAYFGAASDRDVTKGTGKTGGGNEDPGNADLESKKFNDGLDAIFGIQGTGTNAGDE